MSDINKIIRVLDLSKSDARDGTLDGIIKYIIYNSGAEGIETKDIAKEIAKELTLEVHGQDITDSLNRLNDENIINKTDKGNLKLILDEELKLKQQALDIEQSRKARFALFQEHIERIATEIDYAIVEDEIAHLWEVFRTFIYECYLTHGKNAISSLTSSEVEYEDSVKLLVKKYQKETKNKKLSKILSKYIKIYPDVIDTNILKYLTDLANKTEAFYSLGLSQDEYKKLYDELQFDWIVFVDTNFIYSILNLHNHPENQAAKFLLELGTELGIKFKYITKTYNELNHKKADFEKYLEKDLQPSQIKALLQSSKLDSFAQSYYEKLIEDKENTPHPSDIITHSQNSMKEKSLVIYNSKFERLVQSEEYLKDQESKYNSYFELLDEARQEKGLRRKGQKDPLQIQHDVFLREAILSLRKVDATSMNSAKYFGVTLDKILIKFDAHQLRKKAIGVIIPTFFKPSILLKKLLRQAPLKTKENYLRAFVSTISTPAIDDNTYVSRVAIRSLKYFHNLGIDNEKLIIGCLKDELFLKNFEQKEDNVVELNDFVESEINKQITIQTDHMKSLEDEIKKKSKRLDKASELSSITATENEELNKKANELKERLKLYEKELKKIKTKTEKVGSAANTLQFSIYDEQQKIAEDKKNETLIDTVVQAKLKERNQIGALYILIAIILFLPIIMIFLFKENEWNFMTSLVNEINQLDDFRKNTCYTLLTLFFGFVEFIVVKKILKIFNKDEKDQYIKKLKSKY
ncbi:hypothetical protein [uncultured Croceitalea sp.]|uniref:hypothetical protein n=1 Tax=uncultured Croceitalea sp. TaxID=1798908 RepID=UPI00330633B7